MADERDYEHVKWNDYVEFGDNLRQKKKTSKERSE
jgi:hypothetical protein